MFSIIYDNSALRFDMADLKPPILPTNGEADEAANLTDLQIEVRDADSDTAQLPLSHVHPLQPLIEGQYLKSAFLHDTALGEPILQTFSFPLADFAVANNAFDPGSLSGISFVFSATPSGSIVLDDVGIAVGD